MGSGAYGAPWTTYGARVRLVLVDNDPDALELLELDLSLEGHHIVGVAGQGDDAVEMVKTTSPDIVVIDYRMPPGIDGLETARRLRKLSRALRIVLYTNHVREELLDEAMRLDVEYLRKGDLASLRRAILGGS